MMDVSEMGFGLANFSSRGPTRDDRMKPEIAAPGVNIGAPKANSTNQYVVYSGTSMATPFVSGTIALMLDANPGLSLAQVREILRVTAKDLGPAGQDIDYGWGRLDGYEAVKRAGNFSGTAPTVPGHVAFSGTIAQQGAEAEHSFTVTDASYPLNVTLLMPTWTSSNSPDLDLYVFAPDGSEVGRATGSSRQEQVARRITQTGTYRVVVKAYAGTGEYVVDISGGSGGSSPPPDLPPTVAIDQPTEGATVSGTTAVKVKAADDAQVSKVELAVDGGAYADITGGFDGTHYVYQWNTGAVANGGHTLTARATDSAGQTAQANRSVTVSNQAPPPSPPPPPPPDGAQQITRQGQVDKQHKDANVEFDVLEAGYVDLQLTWPTSADLDFYVYAPNGTYIGRAYSLSNPERLRVDTVRWGTGTYRVRVNLYKGPDSAFTLTALGFKQDLLTGSVTPSAPDSTHTRTLAYTGRGRVTLGWPGTSDIDFYVYDPSGAERARAYTLNNPEQADVIFGVTGAWSVRVNLYRGAATSYTLKLFVPDAVLR